ncbi:MAG: energy-coupling factor transport system ATP-binding protein [Clostridia bacterium]|nr:cobalt transporter, ATPase subunit [Clostridiales bacterium]MDK2985297.1 energy-coupling factor transport system ATP-binding protein [Clostridia bacterium]
MLVMIVFDKVSFTYGENLILKEISLKISPGELVAIVGPNGSGKSTLVKHINGLLLPTDGEVTIDGLNTKTKEHLWEIRSRVGIVFQNPENNLVASTVEEDVAFGPENLGYPPEKIVASVKKALQAVGMEQFSKRPIQMLSGGQKQKVALAGALALGSKYLILDEATSMLDPQGQQELLSVILKLNKEKLLSVIMVTHNIEEAALASRIIGISEGRIAFDGTPREIFSNSDLLEEIESELPEVTKLGYRLESRGLNLKNPVLSEDELVKRLCCSI